MKQILLLVMLYPLLGFSQWTPTQNWASGTQTDNDFGHATALNANGDIIAISAPLDDNFSLNNRGRVEIHQNTSGTWQQIGSQLYGSLEDRFGSSISLNSIGNILAVGASNGGPSSTGSVTVYQYSGGSWTQIGAELTGLNAGDSFGTSVDLNAAGDVLVVGAKTNQPTATQAWGLGYTRVYINVNNNWIQIGQDIYGEDTNDESGAGVAISGINNIIAIGAPGDNNTNGPDSGLVRLYQYDINTNQWLQLGGDIFGATSSQGGRAVDLNHSGNIVAFGGSQWQSSGARRGKVRVYEFVSGNWSKIGNDMNGNTGRDWYGTSVSLNASGNVIAAGGIASEPFHQTGLGYVKIFKNNSGTWTQVDQDITGKAFAAIGTSVSLSNNGSILAVGAPKHTDSNGNVLGRAEIFENSNILSSKETNLKENRISIQQNPIQSKLILAYSNQNIKSLKLYNLQGQIIKELNPTLKHFDVSDLSSGLYLLQVRVDNSSSTLKLIKE